MSKIRIIGWLTVVCFSLSSFRLSSWVRIPLELAGNDDDNASVLIPAQVEKADSSSSGKKVIARDSAGIYCVITWNIATGDGLHDSHRRRMYAELLKPFANDTNRTVSDRTDIVVNEYLGVSFLSKEIDPGSNHVSITYGRCVISEHKGYLLLFAPADNGRNADTQSNPFFSSFTLH